jgi:hypothetical protein
MALFQPSYRHLLDVGKFRKGAIFLDIGCCSENRIIVATALLSPITYTLIVGTDARKLIADGYPLEQVVTSDLRQGRPPFPN